MTVAPARIAPRPAEFFADDSRRVADVEICGCWEKAAKSIKIQSALIALLIFDLRARSLIRSVDRGARPRENSVLPRCDGANDDRVS